MDSIHLRELQLDDYDKGGCTSLSFRKQETVAGLRAHEHMADDKAYLAAHAGYLQLLAQLTTVGDVTKAEFEGVLAQRTFLSNCQQSRRLTTCIHTFPAAGRARELIGDPSYRIVVAEGARCRALPVAPSAPCRNQCQCA